MSKYQRSLLQLSIINDLGYKVHPDATVLDFGCGAGGLVKAYRDKGYQAYGCDVSFKDGADVAVMQKEGTIRLIDLQSYRLPFDDGMFDLVVSDQVMEHVQDYSQALSEIKRVLRPGGVCLHFFPARYKPIEPHAYVPLASFIQSYWWLSIWAYLGIRNEHQGGLSPKEVAIRNFDYLRNNTNYLKKAELRKEFEHFFPEVKFCERAFLRNNIRARFISKISKVFPFIPGIYSTFHSRVVVTRSSS